MFKKSLLTLAIMACFGITAATSQAFATDKTTHHIYTEEELASYYKLVNP